MSIAAVVAITALGVINSDYFKWCNLGISDKSPFGTWHLEVSTGIWYNGAHGNFKREQYTDAPIRQHLAVLRHLRLKEFDKITAVEVQTIVSDSKKFIITLPKPLEATIREYFKWKITTNSAAIVKEEL